MQCAFRKALEQLLARSPKIHFGLLALLCVGFAAVPPFRTSGNLLNVLDQSAALAILAIGQAFVIAGGLIDLSVGQLVGLVTVVACAADGGASGARRADRARCRRPARPLVGLVNGELINRLKIPPLILTFGMLSILQGVIFTLTDRSIGRVVAGDRLARQRQGRRACRSRSSSSRSSRSRPTCCCSARVFGWHLLALGNSAESDAPRRHRRRRGSCASPSCFPGLCAGLAGLIVAGRLGTGYPNAGDGMELDAIVAVVLGGTPLKGGRVSIARHPRRGAAARRARTTCSTCCRCRPSRRSSSRA